VWTQKQLYRAADVVIPILYWCLGKKPGSPGFGGIPGLRSGLLALLLIPMSVAQAALVQQTINIADNGDTTEWATVLANAEQVGLDGDGRACPSVDLDTGSPCSKLTPGGRDLKTFTFTWDATNLYIYVSRWDTSNNVTDWWFYLDTDNDETLDTDEFVFRVSWQGSNQNTERVLYRYIESAAGGDPLKAGVPLSGDGYTMPGTLGTSKDLGAITGGEADQTAMESYIPWSELTAATPPISLGFHISSSNGAAIPGSIIDNMDGPSIGFSFPDLSVTKTVDRDPVWAGNDFTYTVTVTNNGDAEATGITLTDLIPDGLGYVSHVASQGTYTPGELPGPVGTGLWDIGTIPYTTPTLTSVTLTLTVKGDDVMSPTLRTNTAGTLTLNEGDPDLTNNAASVDVTVNPRPVLTILKSANKATSKPGEIITYTLEVTNTGNGAAGSDSVFITDLLSRYTAFGIDAMSGSPFGIQYTGLCGVPSGLTMGTPDYSNLNDIPRTYGFTPAGSGWDADVTAWKLPFTGSMAAGGCFTLQYKVQVK